MHDLYFSRFTSDSLNSHKSYHSNRSLFRVRPRTRGEKVAGHCYELVMSLFGASVWSLNPSLLSRTRLYTRAEFTSARAFSFRRRGDDLGASGSAFVVPEETLSHEGRDLGAPFRAYPKKRHRGHVAIHAATLRCTREWSYVYTKLYG